MKRSRLILWPLPVAVLAAGCAPTIAIREPMTATALSFEALTTGQPVDPVELDKWWRLFEDPQLDTLIDRALLAGSDAQLALARLEEARAIRSSALSRFRLQGDLQSSLSAQRIETISGDATFAGGGAPGTGGGAPPGGGAGLVVGDTDSASANINLSWEIDLFGRREATRRGADSDLAAARFLYEGSRATLAADVADALFAAGAWTTALSHERHP